MPPAKVFRQLYSDFTPTQARIRDWICIGLGNKAIADRLKTSEQTVKNMIGRMFDKVGCSNRVEFFLMTHRSAEEIQHELEIEELQLLQRLRIVRKKIDFAKNLGFVKKGPLDEEKEPIVYDLGARAGIASILSDLATGQAN